MPTFLLLLLFCSMIFLGNIGTLDATAETEKNCFSVSYENNNNVDIVRLTNIQTVIKQTYNNSSQSINLEKLCKNYNLNKELFMQSKNIIIQTETLYDDNVINNTNEKVIQLYGNSVNPDYTGESTAGNITFKTIAYQVGTTERGNKVYCIEVTATMNGGYQTNNTDNLVIFGDAQTTFNSNYKDKINGTYKYKRYYKRAKQTIIDVNKVTPNYSSIYGINYSFKTPMKFQPRIAVLKETKITGNYFLTAINDCSVNVAYIHNNSLFADSISITIGVLGLSFDKASHKDYYATPLSLYR